MTQVHARVADAQAVRYASILRTDRFLRAGQPTDPIAVGDLQAQLPDSRIDKLASSYRRRFLPGGSGARSFAKANIEIPPIHPPTGKQYEKLLRKHILTPFYKSLRANLSEAAGAAQAYYAVGNMPAPDITGLHRSTVDKYFRRLAKKHRHQIIKTFREALGVDVGILLNEGPILQELELRVIENVDLIKSIPRRLQDDLQKDFLQMLNESPFDRSLIAKTLRDRYGVTGRRLRLITRDQTSKAIGAFTHIRQTQCGVTHYRWLSSKDERVRPSHEDNEGNIYAWDEPPANTGAPGADYQCRCSAVALIPESSPLDTSSDN